MAGDKDKKLIKKISLAWLHKLKAGIALLALIVMTISGVTNGVSFITIGFRSCLVILIIIGICRFLVSIFTTYEDINGQG
jgi:hypothetical protein